MENSYLIENKLREIAAVADLYPGVVIVLNRAADCVEYMSARGIQLLGTSMAELRARATTSSFLTPTKRTSTCLSWCSCWRRTTWTKPFPFFSRCAPGRAGHFAGT